MNEYTRVRKVPGHCTDFVSSFCYPQTSHNNSNPISKSNGDSRNHIIGSHENSWSQPPDTDHNVLHYVQQSITFRDMSAAILQPWCDVQLKSVQQQPGSQPDYYGHTTTLPITWHFTPLCYQVTNQTNTDSKNYRWWWWTVHHGHQLWEELWSGCRLKYWE